VGGRKRCRVLYGRQEEMQSIVWRKKGMESIEWEEVTDAEYYVRGRKGCRALCGGKEVMQSIVWEAGREAYLEVLCILWIL
jgi:hypothetical protein